MNTTPLEQFQKDIKSLPPIYSLFKRAWTFVFEQDLLSVNEEVLIYQDLVKWSKALDYQKKIRIEAYGDAWGGEEAGKNGHPLDEISLLLENISKILENNRMGGFDSLIKGVRRAGLSWRRLELYDINKWFPEANTFKIKSEGIKAGQEALEENKKEFPHHYSKEIIKDIE